MEVELIERPSELEMLNSVLPELNIAFDDANHGQVQKVISGLRKEFIRLRVRFAIMQIIFREYRNPFKSFKISRTLLRYRKKFAGARPINKITKVDGKYYWALYSPGFRTKIFNDFILGEAARILPSNKSRNRFRNIFIAITKRCPFHCEHCFEWDSLNGMEKLTLSDIISIVSNFQDKGTSQFQLTGGEPMLRVNDILEILKAAKPGTEFWVLTSGYNFTKVNAEKLKKAGLTGVVISLDHYFPEMHNKFRGSAKSYDWAQLAVKNALASNLVTALSICVSKSFVSESNLLEYAELAKKMGVSFVQILEPRSVGHYSGKDVTLKPEHVRILEDFSFKMNYFKKYREYPIVIYHGFHQRKLGCFAAGNRNLYIDTDGDINACPFCRAKIGSAITGNIDYSIEKLQSAGCHEFKNAEF
jgi:MoaA/NifB/PqqE/SkfB family radical SAM enzyme